MKANRLKLNLDKLEVLLISQKVDQRIGIQPIVLGLYFPQNTDSLLGYSQPYTWMVVVARSEFVQLKPVCQIQLFSRCLIWPCSEGLSS